MDSTAEAPLEGQDIVPGQVIDSVDWLSLCREAYDTSTDYFDANYRGQVERNVANFRSKHPSGSKYLSDAYKGRSRIFRPKLRAAQRKAEAAFASAMFSTTDIVQIEPVNQDSAEDDALSEVWESVLGYRLKHSIPWYLTSVAAFQKAQVDGVCISRQTWEYRDEVEQYVEVDALGNEFERERRNVKSNKPAIRLIEIENIRFDPAADWTDPLGTSPYVIEVIPMFLGDIMGYISGGTPAYRWRDLTREEICAANRDFIGNRIARNPGESDPADVEYAIKEFELVYVFRVVMNRDGQDWEYYTVGTRLMLSDPEPLVSPVGRGYVLGISNIEAHRAIPASAMELGQGLQAEANDIANLRLDNVKLALNRRRIIQRGKGTDLGAVSKFRPGGIILTDDVHSMREEDVSDVTSSSYAEQDRLNVDIDDVVGGFSSASVASNRSLNQTVGGMQLLNNSANVQTEYVIRTFVETWVEPTLSQVIALIQAHEDISLIESFARDDVVEEEQQQGGVAAGQMMAGGLPAPGAPSVQQPGAALAAGTKPKKRRVDLSDESILRPVKVSVSVGFGNLDPKVKIQGLTQTLTALAGFSPKLIARIDEEALGREVFSTIGYRNGKKFFKPEAEMQQGGAPSPEAQAEAMRAEVEKQKLQLEAQRMQAEIELKQLQLKDGHDRWMAELQMKYQMSQEQMRGQLGIDSDRLNLDIIREMGQQEKIKRDREEMVLKQRMGQGI